MPIYLDTSGRPHLGIAVCARCGIKHPLGDLRSDPNYPGLMCCPDDIDVLDPYRLAPRETEDITLIWARPDFPLSPGPRNVFVDQPNSGIGIPVSGLDVVGTGSGVAYVGLAPAVAVIQQPAAWTANSAYTLGAEVTPTYPVGLAAAGGPEIFVFLCLVPGRSGATPPLWNTAIGATTTDNLAIWVCRGLYLP